MSHERLTPDTPAIRRPHWMDVPPHVRREDGDIVFRMSRIEADRVADAMACSGDEELEQVADAIRAALGTRP